MANDSCIFKGSILEETEIFLPSTSRSREVFSRVRRRRNGIFTSVDPTVTAIAALAKISSEALICWQRSMKSLTCLAIVGDSIPNCFPHPGHLATHGSFFVGWWGMETRELQWVQWTLMEKAATTGTPQGKGVLVVLSHGKRFFCHFRHRSLIEKKCIMRVSEGRRLYVCR